MQNATIQDLQASPWQNLKADDGAQEPDPYLEKLNRLYTTSDPYFGRNLNR